VPLRCLRKTASASTSRLDAAKPPRRTTSWLRLAIDYRSAIGRRRSSWRVLRERTPLPQALAICTRDKALEQVLRGWLCWLVPIDFPASFPPLIPSRGSPDNQIYQQEYNDVRTNRCEVPLQFTTHDHVNGCAHVEEREPSPSRHDLRKFSH
jgi:hypothetical protein